MAQSHKDPFDVFNVDKESKAKQEAFFKELERRALSMREKGESIIASQGIDEPLSHWSYKGLHVKKLEDDKQGILRISIGGGDDSPIPLKYCTFRGDKEACIKLLQETLEALKNPTDKED